MTLIYSFLSFCVFFLQSTTSRYFLLFVFPLLPHSQRSQLRRSQSIPHLRTINWGYIWYIVPVKTVMSTNIRIYEYSNKMALEYYSHLYSCHFPSTNIFGYSFVDFWTTEYILIFVCKFLKIRIYLNICKSLILIFAYLFLM